MGAAQQFAGRNHDCPVAPVIGKTPKYRCVLFVPPAPRNERMLLRLFILLPLSFLANTASPAAEQGADQRLQHWAYQPIKPTLPPTVAGLTAIDAFLAAKLQEKGLTFSPAADRRILIRRLSFDLLGLPPSPEEVEAFVANKDPNAYEQLVDSFLQSPHFGERQARHWLDIAHYADTHGFERDKRRDQAWRYRDYVIDAFNSDKPYNEFLQQQIAGDVLRPEDPAAVIATGFLAAGPWDFVGQVETKSDVLRRSARALDLDDMVTQVMTCTVGTTINCARCHDHKLDPITQREYYELWAVFAGLKRGDREVNTAEAGRIAAAREKSQARLREVVQELGRLTGEGLDLADMIGGGNGRGTGKKDAGLHPGNGTVVTAKLGYHRDIRINRLQKPEWDKTAAPKFVQWVFVPDGKETVNVSFNVPDKGVPATSGYTWDAIRNGPLAAQVGTIIDHTDYGSPGHSILGLHANGGVVFNLAEIRKANGLQQMRFTSAVGFGASPNAAASLADFTVFVDGEMKFQRLKMRKDEFAYVSIAIPPQSKTLTLLATDGGDGISSDLLFLGDAKLSPNVDALPLTPETKSRIAALQAEEKKLTAELKTTATAPQVYGVIAETPPTVQILRRGDPESPGDPVAPGSIAALAMLKPDFGNADMPEGQRRLALAHWITDEHNPLTRRVIANRLWHWHFGQGIVNTPSDFGLGGDRPSHPELLDWMADELLHHGWSLKHLHKLIVMSAAYQQVSSTTGPQAEVDGNNRLLWRQNPRRLEAESLRDAVLSVTGCLNPQRGGPGYEDFQYQEAYAPIYDYITPDDPSLWRRSIYRFVVRSTPQRFMTTLDCPDPANLTPSRLTTTTALQSLALFNNDFMLRQSQHLKERLEKDAGNNPSDQVRRAYTLLFARPPTPHELAGATTFASQQGLFALCRTLLNSNEFVYVD